MTKFSQRLKDRIAELSKDERVELSEVTDGCCTAGYDNDGCTGAELVENGIRLAVAAKKYHRNAEIFYATGPGGESTAGLRFYVFGTDEQDALNRLEESVAEFVRAVSDE